MVWQNLNENDIIFYPNRYKNSIYKIVYTVDSKSLIGLFKNLVKIQKYLLKIYYITPIKIALSFSSLLIFYLIYIGYLCKIFSKIN